MELKKILEEIALPARSNKKGFKVTDKLEKINAILREHNSAYMLIRQSPYSWIFAQKEIEQDDDILLVSTHSDIVDSITNPYSNYMEDEQYYKGTYDNLGTNAACVYLMLKGTLPDNVVFAFTADEETGRCKGAKDALIFVRTQTEKEPIVFALDVTDEGYHENRLFTVEGLHAQSERQRREMLELFLSTEGEKQSFEVVRLRKKDDNSFLPKSYQAQELTVYDESVFYAEENCNSCSICLPGSGYMHSNSGFFIKEAVMLGYNLALELSILTFLKDKFLDKEYLETLKKQKDELVQCAENTVFYRQKFSSYSSSFSGYSHASYSHKKSYDQIPGQMTLFGDNFLDEYNEPEDYLYVDDEPYTTYNNGIFKLESCLDEIYEVAVYYSPHQFQIFYEDILYTYGLVRNDSLEKHLNILFSDVHNPYHDYDDDDDYQLYDD